MANTRNFFLRGGGGSENLDLGSVEIFFLGKDLPLFLTKKRFFFRQKKNNFFVKNNGKSLP